MGIVLVLLLLFGVCNFSHQLPLKFSNGLNPTEVEAFSFFKTQTESGELHGRGRNTLAMRGDCSTQCGSMTLNWPLSIDDNCGLPSYRLLCDKVFGFLYFNAGGVTYPVLFVGNNFILVGLDRQGFTNGFCQRQNGSTDIGVRSGEFVIQRQGDPPTAFVLSDENVVLINNSVDQANKVEPGSVEQLEGFLQSENYEARCSNFTQLSSSTYPGCPSCCVIPFPKNLKNVTFGSRGHCRTSGPRLTIGRSATNSLVFNRPAIRLDFPFPEGYSPAATYTPVGEESTYQCNYCSPKWPAVPLPFTLDNGIAPCGDRGFYLVCDRLKGDLFFSIGQNLFNVVRFDSQALYVDGWRLVIQGCGESKPLFLTLGKSQKLYWSARNTALAVGCNAIARLDTEKIPTQRCNVLCNPSTLDRGFWTIPNAKCRDNYCCNTTFPGGGKSLPDHTGQFTFLLESGTCGESLAVIGDPSTFDIANHQVWLKLVFGAEEDVGGGKKSNAGATAGIVVGVVGAVFLMALTFLFVRWRMRRGKSSSSRSSDPEASKVGEKLEIKSFSSFMGVFSGCISSQKEGSLNEMKLPPLALPRTNSPSCMNQWDTQVVPTASSSGGNSGEITRQILAGKIAIGDVSLLKGANGDLSGGRGEVASTLNRRGAEDDLVPAMQGPHSAGATSDSVCGAESEEDRLVRAGSDASDKLTGLDMRSLLPIQLNEIDLRLENMIGGGGYGRVYRWERLGTQYAVKVVRGEPQELRDLWQEVVLLKELRHPNVVQFIFACEKPPNEIYIVMEYVQKGSLYKLLHETKQSLSTRQKVHMAWDVAKGMAFLHEINVVHRDLKSANLLVSHDGTIKVCDFGQSRLLNGTHLTTDNRAGTLPYTAPEAFEDFQRCPKESDVYAYGILLWELFSGEIPWNKHAEVEIMKSIVMDKRRPPISPDWPSAVIDIITRCWAQDPNHRPTFANLTAELRAVFESLPVDPKASHRRRLRTSNGSQTTDLPLPAHMPVQKEAA